MDFKYNLHYTSSVFSFASPVATTYLNWSSTKVFMISKLAFFVSSKLYTSHSSCYSVAFFSIFSTAVSISAYLNAVPSPSTSATFLDLSSAYFTCFSFSAVNLVVDPSNSSYSIWYFCSLISEAIFFRISGIAKRRSASVFFGNMQMWYINSSKLTPPHSLYNFLKSSKLSLVFSILVRLCSLRNDWD